MAIAHPAAADPELKLSAAYVVDVSGPVSGGRARGGRALDNLLIGLGGPVSGTPGATFQVSLLNNSGGSPNDLAGALQGVDNIEVTRPRGRIYEAWINQDFDSGSLRIGLYDLNSEFYSNPSAGLLIAPAFGIGSELAATGPNGPSIFPSTALAARLRVEPGKDFYLQAAILGAKAGVIGDPGGVDLTFSDGILSVAEAGWTGRGKLAIGAWRYSRRQPTLSPSGPLTRGLDTSWAYGGYLLLDQPVRGHDGDVRSISAFLRLGMSDGETTPFNGGGQAGVVVKRVFDARPESALSFGVSQGRLGANFRQGLHDAGIEPAAAEYAAELTYADTLSDRVTLQPSVDVVRAAGGDHRAKDEVILTLRVRINLK
jgi:porin